MANSATTDAYDQNLVLLRESREWVESPSLEECLSNKWLPEHKVGCVIHYNLNTVSVINNARLDDQVITCLRN